MTGYDHQAERLAQVKGSHIRLHPAYVGQALAFLFCDCKHMRRKIQPGDAGPSLGQANGDPACSAGKLEQTLCLVAYFRCKA